MVISIQYFVTFIKYTSPDCGSLTASILFYILGFSEVRIKENIFKGEMVDFSIMISILLFLRAESAGPQINKRQVCWISQTTYYITIYIRILISQYNSSPYFIYIICSYVHTSQQGCKHICQGNLSMFLLT